MKNHWLTDKVMSQLVHNKDAKDKYFGQYCIARTELTRNLEPKETFYLEKDTLLWSSKKYWYRKEGYNPSIYYYKSKEAAEMIYVSVVPEEERIK